ncbi:MAG: DUF5710 domain-containing protein [Gammaproteobacteria bacterium]
MSVSKLYLNVPYAQKDEAKGLGARWDPAAKKWYIPAGKDIAAFAKWHRENDITPESDTDKSRQRAKLIAAGNAEVGVFTYPTIDQFSAYNGETPPWD